MLLKAIRCVLCGVLFIALSCPLFAAGDAGKFMYLLAQMTSKEEGKAEEAWEMLSGSLDPRAHAVLMAGLSHKDPRIRGNCASLLGARKDPGAATALLPLLHDRDFLVRYSTVSALGDIGDPSSREPLIGLLSDQDSRVRAMTVRVLRRSGGEVVDVLLKALDDSNASVRRAAINQLGMLKDPRAAAPLAAIARGADNELREDAIEALGYLGPVAIDALLRLQSSVEVEVRRAVVNALVTIEDPRVVEAIRSSMMDDDPIIRQSAFLYLGLNGDAEMRNIIFGAFNDRNSIARDQLGFMLKVYGGDPDYYQRVVSLIGNLEFVIDWCLALNLQDWRHPRLVEPLLARVAEPDCPVEIITAFGKQRDPRAVSALVALLSSTQTITEDPDTGEAVYQDEPDEEDLLFLQDYFSPASKASKALIDIGTPAVDVLLAALCSEDRRTRIRAALTLGEIADPRTLPALLETLRDGDIKVRRAAVMALGTLGDARGYEALIARLDEKDKELWDDIIQALSDSRDPRLIPLFTKMAKSRDEWKRILAVSALGQMDDPRVTQVMLYALRDRSDDVRYAATYFYGWSTGPSAADGLVGALGDRDDKVRRNAEDQLRDMDTAAVTPALVKALRSRNKFIRAGAADAASAHRDPHLTAALLQALTDREYIVRSSASWALSEFRDPAIRPHLERLLANPPYLDTREECIQLLGSIGAADVLILMLNAATRPDERKAILSALSETGDVRALDALAAALDDPDSDIQYYAASGLARLKDGRATQLLLQSLAEGRGDLFVLDDSDIPVPAELLQRFFTGPSALAAYTMNAHAISIAGKQGERWAADRMLEMLDVLTRCPERDGTTCPNREALIKALGDLREARAIEWLVIALDGDDEIATVAAEALGKIGGARAAEALLLSLPNQPQWSYDDSFLRTAGQALGGIKDGQERERLTGAISSGSWRIRYGAALALGATGEAWAIPPALTALADPQPEVRAAAAEALGRLLAKEAAPALTKALTDPYPEVRAAAMAALTAIGE